MHDTRPPSHVDQQFGGSGPLGSPGSRPLRLLLPCAPRPAAPLQYLEQLDEVMVAERAQLEAMRTQFSRDRAQLMDASSQAQQVQQAAALQVRRGQGWWRFWWGRVGGVGGGGRGGCGKVSCTWRLLLGGPEERTFLATPLSQSPPSFPFR